MTPYDPPRPAGSSGLVVSLLEDPSANSPHGYNRYWLTTDNRGGNTMPVRPGVRFDVFRRDDFACSYCGRKPPEVTLEADHIIPLAEGGTDDPENLTTACWDCNRGKGAKQLDAEPPAIPDLAERTEMIEERERQLRAYHLAIEASARRQDESFERVWQAWFSEWGVETLERWETPSKAAVRRYIDELGEREVLDAIESTGAKFRWVNNSCVRYFFGILKWKTADAKGLVVPCIICTKRLMLEPGDDPTAEWFHTKCNKENADG